MTADFLNKARRQMELRLPFAIYSKPNSDIVNGFFQSTDALFQASDFTEKGFVFASFDRVGNILIPENESEFVIAKKGASSKEVLIRTSIPADEKAKAAFEILIQKGLDAIAQNKFKKVVLSRKESLKVDNFDFASFFEMLTNVYPTAFCYCFFHPKTGLWVGASPEQLLQVNGDKFATTALAGTRQSAEIENMIWEDKEKEEQQFVTDFIMENLEGVAADIAISNPYSYRAGNLLHIKSDIEGAFRPGSTLQEILDILHPTPAVCGFPKDAAKKFILENEGYERRFYSGFLGEMNIKSKTDLFVNLRCMEMVEDHANIYVGCGVTKGSDPKLEFDETVSKSMTMKNILNSGI